MSDDRMKICEIISDMLDGPDDVGIYPTSTAYTRLERYIEEVRMEALGWAHAYFCVALDGGMDPRLQEVPEMLAQAKKDLAGD